MSNILNSCFFTLYKHGVKQNVEVNVEDDICIIFMLLESIKLDEIPFEDKESLNYIIKYLKKKNSSHFLFNEEKWKDFIEYFNKKSIDFNTKLPSEKYNVFTKLPYHIKEFLNVIDTTSNWIYNQYEYGPNYLDNRYNITHSMNRLEGFKNIKDILLDTVNNKLHTVNNKLHIKPSFCNLLKLYSSMSGGFNKYIIKIKKNKN